MTKPAVLLLLFLTACSGGSGIGKKETSPCPPPQWADEKVGTELMTIPYEKYEDLWLWLDRIEKLNEQLEACRK